MLSILASLNNHNVPKKTNRLSRHAPKTSLSPKNQTVFNQYVIK